MHVEELAKLQPEEGDLQGLDPIDDIRATREYRLDAAAELVRRVVLECAKP
jgi:CO/xanthine dehydrogenase FAD-binding subunit